MGRAEGRWSAITNELSDFKDVRTEVDIIFHNARLTEINELWEKQWKIQGDRFQELEQDYFQAFDAVKQYQELFNLLGVVAKDNALMGPDGVIAYLNKHTNKWELPKAAKGQQNQARYQ